MNLNDMSLSDLKALRKDVDKAIDGYKERQRQTALAELEQKAAEMGYSLADLVKSRKSKSVSAPKYRNPEDPSQTWTGRGRTPQWMKDLEASGKSRDSALI